MLYYNRIDTSKSNKSKKCIIGTVGFLIMDSNFKILDAMSAMI